MERDPGVDTYLDGVPTARRAALVLLRAACGAELDGFTESLRYQMPSYERDGVVEVAFANQARYISLYILRSDVLGRHRAGLAGIDVGKGAIRYRRPEDIDLEVVRSMLQDTVRSTGEVC